MLQVTKALGIPQRSLTLIPSLRLRIERPVIQPRVPIIIRQEHVKQAFRDPLHIKLEKIIISRNDHYEPPNAIENNQ